MEALNWVNSIKRFYSFSSLVPGELSPDLNACGSLLANEFCSLIFLSVGCPPSDCRLIASWVHIAGGSQVECHRRECALSSPCPSLLAEASCHLKIILSLLHCYPKSRICLFLQAWGGCLSAHPVAYCLHGSGGGPLLLKKGTSKWCLGFSSTVIVLPGLKYSALFCPGNGHGRLPYDAFQRPTG